MGAWRFSLEPLLERSRQRETHERELFDRLRVELQTAQNQIQALERGFCANVAAARAADLDFRAISTHYACSEQIVRQIKDLRRRVCVCDESTRVAGEGLARARALRKTLEALKARQLVRRRQAEEQFEERELDEVNAARMTPAGRT